MITGKIDVTKIDKNKLFKGAKGTYLNFVLIETPNNTFGNDYMIVESISKEEREQGIQGRILGSAKILTKREASPEAESMAASDLNNDNDLPF